MPTQNIPLQTITASQVIGPLVEPTAGLSGCVLSLDRNVGANTLDSLASGSIAGTLLVEWSSDGGNTFNLLMSIGVAGGIIFKDKAQTIREETSSIQVGFPSGCTHVRGTYTNGANTITVSGTFTQS